jgi:tetratricopeptide (TPR) repeat protein
VQLAENFNLDVRNARDLRFYFAREPIILAALSLVAIISFIGVSALSRLYHAQQTSLGERWFQRGVVDLNSQHFDRAVVDFRTALLYSRDNYDYRLNLAEALLGLKRTDEASTYLRNLWEREPENGLVNLELARIAVQANDTEHALRYYHNAIYAAWPAGQENRRRETRFELIQFLLDAGLNAQAQSELIALAANVEEDPTQHKRIADLFFRAGDYEHALAEYRVTLKSDPHDAVALAGAGQAAFQLRHYDIARDYLRSASAGNSLNVNLAGQLKEAELILQLDPLRRGLSSAQRAAIAQRMFSIAGDRLHLCSKAPDTSSAPTNSKQDLAGEWQSMKSRLSEQSMQRHPELLESAMDLSFRIERETSTTCAAQTDEDQALLLISKLHEGSEPATGTGK